MKIARLLLVAAAAFFIASNALAQNAGTVTQYAFAIGKGAGQTGFTSLLCGSAQLAVGQSAAAPICRTITGDVTITTGGITAIGAGKVTTSMLATQAAYTLLGNMTSGTASPTAFKISSLTATGGFGAGDKLLIEESTGELRKIDYTDLPGAGGFGGTAGTTDNRLIRADGTGGSTLQGSAIAVDDSGNMTGVAGITMSGAIAGATDVGANTVSGSVVAAQAGQETATSTTTVVTPGRQQYHPSAAKAWAYCTQSGGTYTLQASYNISGGTCGKTGTGNLTLTFSTAFSSSSAFGCVGSSSDQVVAFISQNASASTVNIFMRNFSSTATDSGFTVTCFGDQ